MQTRYKYINFRRVPASPTRKTLIYDCHNSHSGAVLGTVRWYGPWRQYCFMDDGRDCVFNRTCLADVQHFLQQLMDRRGKTTTAKGDAPNDHAHASAGQEQGKTT